MAATITLNWQEVLWYLQGGMSGSHLRWSIYEDMVNKIYPQLTSNERECIFAYAKRDLSWHFNGENSHLDETPRKMFLQMLARYNPANQFQIILKKGREKRQIVDAYLWDDLYYIDWSRYCAEEYIKSVQQTPYSKCTNKMCVAKDVCLRYTTYEQGDTLMDNNRDFYCDRCDMVITGKGIIDPVAKMDISNTTGKKDTKNSEKPF